MDDLEDVFLLLLADKNQVKNHWQHSWHNGYPLSHMIIADENADIGKIILQAGSRIIAVAHGYACNVFAHWLYSAGMDEQRNICAAILASPDINSWSEDESAAENRARVNFPAAVVSVQNSPVCDKTEKIARKLGAKHIICPKIQTLDAPLRGWQWGMNLMQDMLLR